MNRITGLFLAWLIPLAVLGQSTINNATINNASIGVASGGGVPYISSVNYFASTNGGVLNQYWTLTNQFTAGTRVVMAWAYEGSAKVFTNIMDNRGNTWLIHTNRALDSGNFEAAIASSVLTTTLQVGDYVTNMFTTAAVGEQICGLFSVVNSTSPDATAGQVYSFYSGANSITAPATVAANSVSLGIIYINNQTATYSTAGAGWSVIGNHYVCPTQSYGINFFGSTNSSAGSTDPLGQCSTGIGSGVVWASFK